MYYTLPQFLPYKLARYLLLAYLTSTVENSRDRISDSLSNIMHFIFLQIFYVELHDQRVLFRYLGVKGLPSIIYCLPEFTDLYFSLPICPLTLRDLLTVQTQSSAMRMSLLCLKVSSSCKQCILGEIQCTITMVKVLKFRKLELSIRKVKTSRTDTEVECLLL